MIFSHCNIFSRVPFSRILRFQEVTDICIFISFSNQTPAFKFNCPPRSGGPILVRIIYCPQAMTITKFTTLQQPLNGFPTNHVRISCGEGCGRKRGGGCAARSYWSLPRDVTEAITKLPVPKHRATPIGSHYRLWESSEFREQGGDVFKAKVVNIVCLAVTIISNYVWKLRRSSLWKNNRWR